MKKPDWKLWMEDKAECRKWLGSYLKKGMIRKSKDDSALHLEKAKHNLYFANWIIEKHKDEIPAYFKGESFYDWTVSIYYYAIYHSAMALMSKEGYSSKSHSATLCFIIYHHYHKQKALDEEDIDLIVSSLDKEDIETIGVSKEMREKACYDVHGSFERSLAAQIQEQAVDFLDSIREIIRLNGNIKK